MFLPLKVKRFHPLIQLRAGSVSAEGVICRVDVFDVLQRRQVDLSRINVSAALRVEPVMQDGKHAVLDRLIFGLPGFQPFGNLSVRSLR